MSACCLQDGRTQKEKGSERERKETGSSPANAAPVAFVTQQGAVLFVTEGG